MFNLAPQADLRALNRFAYTTIGCNHNDCKALDAP
jgi:hypothetical protein